MTSGSLCRCICGSSKTQEAFNPEKNAGTEFTPEHEDADAHLSPAHVDGLLSYNVLADQPLRGVPIREGELWYLSAEETLEPVTLSLYVNGISFVLGSQELPVSFSPFSLVRTCKFGNNFSNAVNLADIKIFKVSLFTQGVCYYFGVRGDDDTAAEEQRGRWVLDVSRAMRLVTQSLFPAFRIMTQPVAENTATQRRLMAGYLVHHEDASLASVLYCELRAHCQETASLVFYENELCKGPIMEICITEHSICCEKVGVNCSCFCIEEHQFATRTISERKLWLRAISNVKVKLQNRAPPPSLEEVEHYREAIRDYLLALRPGLEGRAPSDALLQRAPVTAGCAAAGVAWPAAPAAPPAPPSPPLRGAQSEALRMAGAPPPAAGQPAGLCPPPPPVGGAQGLAELSPPPPSAHPPQAAQLEPKLN